MYSPEKKNEEKSKIEIARIFFSGTHNEQRMHTVSHDICSSKKIKPFENAVRK